MAFDRFKTQVLLRVALLVINAIILAYLLLVHQLWFTSTSLLVLAGIQTFELIWFVTKTNRELTKFIYAIKYADYAVTFPRNSGSSSFQHLYDSFNEVLEMFKQARVEKEAQYQLFKLLLEQIPVGIITVNGEGEITLMNKAASEQLGTPNPKTFDRLRERVPEMLGSIRDMQQGGRRLAEVEINGSAREFSVDVTPIQLLGKQYTTIAFQDIRDEIEQKEVDAWHKLIRILAHEIMNSITPVTSLTATMKSMLVDENGEPLRHEDLDDEVIRDVLMALNTIHRRSLGMLEFVEDYRKLTKLPAPEFEVLRVQDLFEGVGLLWQATFQERGIQFQIALSNKKLQVRCDRKLVEQVLINMVTNALFALHNTSSPKLIFSAELENGKVVLRISDNGSGIEKEKLESIFIPFYTTKSEGTGIGLSLSKNIMRLHNGSVSVRSTPGVETVFELRFPSPYQSVQM